MIDPATHRAGFDRADTSFPLQYPQSMLQRRIGMIWTSSGAYAEPARTERIFRGRERAHIWCPGPERNP
jgi:hypothetical protein